VPPEERDFLCNGWLWDPVLRELRHYPRRRRGYAEDPDGVERLQPARSVVIHRWSQAPMRTATGEITSPRLARVVVEYEAGGNLTVNENDRDCAERLARTIADSLGLPLIEEGAPGGRRAGNLPVPDQMGRLVTRAGKTEVLLDEAAGELVIATRRFPFGRKRRSRRLSEVRRLELTYEVTGPTETFTVWAVLGAEGERVPVARYSGFEGWADPEEWRTFTQELAARLGAQAVV
jgi:hypothetical protein